MAKTKKYSVEKGIKDLDEAIAVARFLADREKTTFVVVENVRHRTNTRFGARHLFSYSYMVAPITLLPPNCTYVYRAGKYTR